jgi:hypothetical protein
MNNQCEGFVWERDTYRYTGRTKTGLELQYRKRRCKRKSMRNARFCFQHIAYRTGIDQHAGAL